MANKTITLTVSRGNSRITITDTIADVSTWMAQAYLFHKFLLAQGFVVEAEDVSAQVGDYVDATVDEEF